MQLVRSPMALKWSDGITRVAASIWKPQERSDNILRLGRRQLQALRREGHPYGDARVRELRRLLAEGGGLPLLFPEHDVGFTYRKGAVLPPPENLRGSDKLTASSSPVDGSSSSESSAGPSGMNAPRSRIVVGGIMPHFLLRPACDDEGQAEGRGGGHRPVVDNMRVYPVVFFSTVDLPDQLRVISRRNCPRYPRKHAVDRVEDGGSRAVRDDPAGRVKVNQAAREASRVSLASVLLIAPSQPSSPLKSGTLGNGSEFTSTENECETWRRIALDVQQDLAAFAAARKNVAVPCPLVIVKVLPTLDNSIDDGTGGCLRSGDQPPTFPGEHVRRRTSTDRELTRFVGSAVGDAPMDVEVLARMDEWWPFYPPAAKNAAGEEDSSRSHLSGVLLMAIRAVDASGGALGRAFALADAEAVLIRPDGHIGWAAPRGTALGKQGHARQRLTEALKTVYDGQNKVHPP